MTATGYIVPNQANSIRKINGETKEEREVFYEMERSIIGERYYVPIDIERCSGLIRMLSIQYELETPKVTFNGRTRNFCYWAKPHLSFIRRDLIMGTAIHEMAHYIENSICKNKKHNDQLMKRISELWNYIDS
jgi:hypothetical protein